MAEFYCTNVTVHGWISKEKITDTTRDFHSTFLRTHSFSRRESQVSTSQVFRNFVGVAHVTHVLLGFFKPDSLTNWQTHRHIHWQTWVRDRLLDKQCWYALGHLCSSERAEEFDLVHVVKVTCLATWPSLLSHCAGFADRSSLILITCYLGPGSKPKLGTNNVCTPRIDPKHWFYGNDPGIPPSYLSITSDMARNGTFPWHLNFLPKCNGLMFCQIKLGLESCWCYRSMTLQHNNKYDVLQQHCWVQVRDTALQLALVSKSRNLHT